MINKPIQESLRTVVLYVLTMTGGICISAQNGASYPDQTQIQQGYHPMYNEVAGEIADNELYKSSHWLIGGLVGLGVGGISTAVVTYSGGSTALCNRSANQDAISPLGCAGLIAGGALVGGGIGILIGSLIKKKHGEHELIEVRTDALSPGIMAFGIHVSF